MDCLSDKKECKSNVLNFKKISGGLDPEERKSKHQALYSDEAHRKTFCRERDESTIENINAFRRILRVLPSRVIDVAKTLLTRGSHSPAQIARLSEHHFIHHHIDAFKNDRSLAEHVYQRAVALSKMLRLEYQYVECSLTTNVEMVMHQEMSHVLSRRFSHWTRNEEAFAVKKEGQLFWLDFEGNVLLKEDAALLSDSESEHKQHITNIDHMFVFNNALHVITRKHYYRFSHADKGKLDAGFPKLNRLQEVVAGLRHRNSTLTNGFDYSLLSDDVVTGVMVVGDKCWITSRGRLGTQVTNRLLVDESGDIDSRFAPPQPFTGSTEDRNWKTGLTYGSGEQRYSLAFYDQHRVKAWTDIFPIRFPYGKFTRTYFDIEIDVKTCFLSGDGQVLVIVLRDGRMAFFSHLSPPTTVLKALGTMARV